MWGRSIRESSERLTAFNGIRRRLQGHNSSAGFGDVHAEDEPHPGVLPADVRLSLPQFDVGVPQLQNPRAVNAGKEREALLCMLVLMFLALIGVGNG